VASSNESYYATFANTVAEAKAIARICETAGIGSGTGLPAPSRTIFAGSNRKSKPAGAVEVAEILASGK
jgi:hypothetical protein